MEGWGERVDGDREEVKGEWERVERLAVREGEGARR